MTKKSIYIVGLARLFAILSEFCKFYIIKTTYYGYFEFFIDKYLWMNIIFIYKILV